MENLDKHEKLPEEEQSVIDDARATMESVLSRMTETSKNYGAAYTLADIQAEFEAEIDDIVGWPLLEAVRIKRVMGCRLEKMSDAYLLKFLKYHDDEYLNKLQVAISFELHKRNKGDEKEL